MRYECNNLIQKKKQEHLQNMDLAKKISADERVNQIISICLKFNKNFSIRKSAHFQKLEDINEQENSLYSTSKNLSQYETALKNLEKEIMQANPNSTDSVLEESRLSNSLKNQSSIQELDESVKHNEEPDQTEARKLKFLIFRNVINSK